MKIGRFSLNDYTFLGVVIEDKVYKIPHYRNFVDLLRVSSVLNITLEDILNRLKVLEGDAIPLSDVRVLIPHVPEEVWGAGVTYKRSVEAREDETQAKGIYDLVYEAQRPEIFFKTTGVRCVGPNDPIGIRNDSEWSVPEPELTFIVGFNGEIVAYTIGNDVTARDIEGENPLYLPQAKIFKNCCALGPFLVTPDEIGNPHNLDIEMTIFRGNDIVFQGKTNTNNMKRKITEILEYLLKCNIIPPGSACLTGTGIVPPDDFSLQDGDKVLIEIEKIGKLENTVIVVN